MQEYHIKTVKRLLFLVITTFVAVQFLVHHTGSYAQETVVQTDTPLGAETPATPSSDMVPQRVEYELPYPGMLPDNPLYVLKVIRDGLVKLLINDPYKRAQFSLLNSDKRIYAGMMLVDKGKDTLAIETIVKSNNYMDDAVIAIKTTMKQTPKSTDIRPFLLTLKTAELKHIEVMSDIKKSIDKNLLQRFTVEEKRMEATSKTVDNLLAQK